MVTALVDFELAHIGDPLFDLATAKLLAVSGDGEAWEALKDAYGLDAEPDAPYRLWFTNCCGS